MPSRGLFGPGSIISHAGTSHAIPTSVSPGRETLFRRPPREEKPREMVGNMFPRDRFHFPPVARMRAARADRKRRGGAHCACRVVLREEGGARTCGARRGAIKLSTCGFHAAAVPPIGKGQQCGQKGVGERVLARKAGCLWRSGTGEKRRWVWDSPNLW